MTGLVLKLRPNEKFLINGVVLQNGDRATRIRVRTPGASVLRLRDAMHPDQAVTPLKRIYYVAQLAVAGEVDNEAAMKEILESVETLRQSQISDSARAILNEAEIAIRNGKIFKAMRTLKRAFSAENALLLGQCSNPQSP